VRASISLFQLISWINSTPALPVRFCCIGPRRLQSVRPSYAGATRVTVNLVIKTGPAHPHVPRLPLECRPHGGTNLILRNFAARFATRQNFSGSSFSVRDTVNKFERANQPLAVASLGVVLDRTSSFDFVRMGIRIGRPKTQAGPLEWLASSVSLFGIGVFIQLLLRECPPLQHRVRREASHPLPYCRRRFDARFRN
jgi:hypothetical protein